MFRRALIVALLLIASSAHASGGAPKKPAAKDIGQYVEIQPVGLPIVVEGKLVNYVFVYVRLNLTSSANTPRWREKEPFFRDALVRAAHRTPFTRLDDYQKIDIGKLTAALTRDALAITGPGVLRSVVVTSEAPRHHVRTPRTAARS
jgi:hypothetical protein